MAELKLLRAQNVALRKIHSIQTMAAGCASSPIEISQDDQILRGRHKSGGRSQMEGNSFKLKASIETREVATGYIESHSICGCSKIELKKAVEGLNFVMQRQKLDIEQLQKHTR